MFDRRREVSPAPLPFRSSAVRAEARRRAWLTGALYFLMTPEPRLSRCDLTVLPKSQPFDLSCSEERQQIHGRNISPCARCGAPPRRTHYRPSPVTLRQAASAEPRSLILVLPLRLNSWLVRTSRAFIRHRRCLNQSINRPSRGQKRVVLELIIRTKLPFMDDVFKGPQPSKVEDGGLEKPNHHGTRLGLARLG